MTKKREMKISRIENGTVIDHIHPGTAMVVFEILNLREDVEGSIMLGIRVDSGQLSEKDLLKIENRFLTSTESAMVALVSPNATINIIRDYEVREKHTVEVPDEWSGIFHCNNPSCISNHEREPVESEFEVKDRHPLVVRCRYCSTLMNEKQITQQLLGND